MSKNGEITTLKERNNFLFIRNNDLKKDTKELQAEVDSNLEKLNASDSKAFNEQNNELIIINKNLKAAVFNKNSKIKSLKERNNELENLQAEVDSKNSKTKVLKEAIVSTNDELMKVKQDFKAAVDSKNSD